jgi:nicotinate-nucleotide pyrophosphorylase (carboxylating)
MFRLNSELGKDMQSPIDIRPLLSAALAEDIGSGDITGNATIPADAVARFGMNAREPLMTAGLVFLPTLFEMIDPAVRVVLMVEDGVAVEKGATLATLEGPARALLAGERTALNLVQQLSGVATLTSRYVQAIAGTNAKILDTRKTIPGWRALQKYAVKCGGGANHRMGLYDAVLIKDNHIAVAGGVAAAISAAKAYVPKGTTIEVECDTLAQVDEAMAAGVDILLLDNMDNAALTEGVRRAHAAGIKTEASGNVNLQTVRAIAETGVDYISVGKLTHSAVAVDIGLDEA